jgi:hypothetical protein
MNENQNKYPRKEKANQFDFWSHSDIGLSAPSQKEKFDLEREAFLLSRAKKNDQPGSFHNDSDRIMFELCAEQERTHFHPHALGFNQSYQQDLYPTELDNDEDFQIFGRFLDINSGLSSSQLAHTERPSKTSRLGSLLGLLDQNLGALDLKHVPNETHPTSRSEKGRSKAENSSAVPKGLVRISTSNLFKNCLNEKSLQISHPLTLTEKQVLESFAVSDDGHGKLSTSQTADLLSKLKLTKPQGGGSLPKSGITTSSSSLETPSQSPAQRSSGGCARKRQHISQLRKDNKLSDQQKETVTYDNKQLKKVDISALFRPSAHVPSSSSSTPFPAAASPPFVSLSHSTLTHHHAHVRVNQDASFLLLSQLKLSSSDCAATIGER